MFVDVCQCGSYFNSTFLGGYTYHRADLGQEKENIMTYRPTYRMDCRVGSQFEGVRDEASGYTWVLLGHSCPKKLAESLWSRPSALGASVLLYGVCTYGTVIYSAPLDDHVGPTQPLATRMLTQRKTKRDICTWPLSIATMRVPVR
jgi:hypothetical protein